MIEPDGSGETNLTGEASGGDPNWSPGGSRIVYESLNDDNFEVYVMNADGCDQTVYHPDAPGRADGDHR